ncbi:hypothetical protein FR483_n055L [Paramecium bursaria Chlorella virus FR483]|uniref:Uncharacterized protein n055L n=1 Tax=Paramecium bursaria Chlorella virus FR483 TaxID=399781 RepID=A7J6A9_PBCVF|nr:hypothetical protein FR483_n055L [Paramecium bursaria Chlorella virus FR483]ABT15340.1 hypothetical protein FR483_n055L [Paramecium bursaria Chlorella virus FR483]
MFPRTFTCPRAMAFPIRILSVVTFEAFTLPGADTFPMMPMGCNPEAGIPVIVDPLPTKYAAETFPMTFT